MNQATLFDLCEDVPDQITDRTFDKVIKRGFPFYELNIEQKMLEFELLRQFPSHQLLEGSSIKQVMHGLNLAWSYFPHSWAVPVKNMKTPMDIWRDPALLRLAIKKRLKRGGFAALLPDGSMTDSQIRKALRSYSGVQAVSNFRPTAAACLYRKFVQNGVVWDMSCGFGGRLLGALSSQTVKKYIGTDPGKQTYKGLQEIAKDFAYIGMDIELNKVGSEHFIPSEPVDFCFTSPPYFDTEQYSTDEAQSFLQYKSNREWNEQFLRKTIKNCKAALKPNKVMAINIADVKSHKTLEVDTVRIAKEEGFTHIDTYQLQLSHISKGGFKSEPVFIFQK